VKVLAASPAILDLYMWLTAGLQSAGQARRSNRRTNEAVTINPDKPIKGRGLSVFGNLAGSFASALSAAGA
jgi:hypothetical protein